LGELEEHGDEDLIERLTAVRGIGVWSAQMFMMFHLGRLDVWPTGDLGVRKGVAQLEGIDELPDRKHMERVGELFAPYRSVAAWYMWRSLDTDGQI
jgi:3-methyladenine DNA glycosylase/8-oxoguanine DNA glycosylase